MYLVFLILNRILDGVRIQNAWIPTRFNTNEVYWDNLERKIQIGEEWIEKKEFSIRIIIQYFSLPTDRIMRPAGTPKAKGKHDRCEKHWTSFRRLGVKKVEIADPAFIAK